MVLSAEKNISRFQVSVNNSFHVTISNTHQDLVDVTSDNCSSQFLTLWNALQELRQVRVTILLHKKDHSVFHHYVFE